MHYLLKLEQEVNRTHARLGGAVAFAAICAKARKCLVIVAPAGTGKSTITSYIREQSPESLRFDSVTRSGLGRWQTELTGFKGLVVIDDLGKVDTSYSRVATVTTFAELCYSHFISKYSQGTEVEIDNFQGGALLNAQPPVIAALVQSDEWEVVAQDKTIRLYHLYRPVKPVPFLPKHRLDWGIDPDLVKAPRSRGKLWAALEDIASVQWSDARCIEHLNDLLRATAAIDHRRTITKDDYLVLHHLMRPLGLERHLLGKLYFEVGRSFNNNLLALMIEFASWGNLTLERIARDYKLTPKRVGELLGQMGTAWVQMALNDRRIWPSKALRAMLEEAGATLEMEAR